MEIWEKRLLAVDAFRSAVDYLYSRGAAGPTLSLYRTLRTTVVTTVLWLHSPPFVP